jgi:chromosomal replication initiation ATPase DnaA
MTVESTLPQNDKKNHIWHQTLADLKGQTTKATHDAWLKKTRLKEIQKSFLDADVYIVEAESDAAVAWLENRLKDTVIRALARVMGEPVSIEFIAKKQEIIEPGLADDLDESAIFRVRDRRKPKRLYIDNTFFYGGYAQKVGPYGIAIYSALALHADADTQEAWPSYNRLAELTGMSRRQAIRKVAELKALNMVVIEKRKRGDGLNESNVIVLLDDSEWKEIK